MKEYTLMDVVGELSNIEHAILNPNTNSWNQSIGDELHQIEYQLGRIADSLEKIANK
jgi:hypothetical protein